MKNTILKRYLSTHAILTLLFLLLSVISKNAVAEMKCEFSEWFEYKQTKIFKHSTSNIYLYKIKKFSADADGAPNAYHPDDVGHRCTDNSYKFKGLDCPGNAGYPKKSWWSSIILKDPANTKEGYVQKEGKYKGYFVSQTSLKDHKKQDSDPEKYVNAVTIPYIVLPKIFYKISGTGSPGDVGYAVNISNGKKSSFIIAEIGPSDSELGEISLSLAQNLGGTQPNPKTGSGLPKGDIVFVVFPKSKASPAWPLTAQQIESKAEDHLRKTGGVDAIIHCAQ